MQLAGRYFHKAIDKAKYLCYTIPTHLIRSCDNIHKEGTAMKVNFKKLTALLLAISLVLQPSARTDGLRVLFASPAPTGGGITYEGHATNGHGWRTQTTGVDLIAPAGSYFDSFRMRLTGMPDWSIWYRVFEMGKTTWSRWFSDNEHAGVAGSGTGIDAIQIMIV